MPKKVSSKKTSFKKTGKKKSEKTSSPPNGLWISPRSAMKGPAGERAWENRPGGTPSSSRFLELADIALGLKKADSKDHRTSRTVLHLRSKTEPYSG